MTKATCTWRDITILVSLLTLTGACVGAFYEDRARITQNAEAITTLRTQHEECERQAAARWDKAADTLGSIQVRGARTEEKLDAVLREIRILHGVDTKDK